MKTLNPMNPQRMPSDMLITRSFEADIGKKDYIDVPLETPDGYAFVAAYAVQSVGWVYGLYLDQYNVSEAKARVYKSPFTESGGYVAVSVLYRKI